MDTIMLPRLHNSSLSCRLQTYFCVVRLSQVVVVCRETFEGT